MKKNKKLSVSIACVLMIICTSTLNAQSPNFIGIATKLLGISISNHLINLMSGKILLKSKAHQGPEYFMTITLKVDSKPILPMGHPQNLHGYDKFSNAMRVSMNERNSNKYGDDLNMSKKETYSALKRINIILPKNQEYTSTPILINTPIKNNVVYYQKPLTSVATLHLKTSLIWPNQGINQNPFL